MVDHTNCKTFIIEFTPQEWQQLESLAVIRGIPVEQVVREAIAAFAGRSKGKPLDDADRLLLETYRHKRRTAALTGPQFYFVLAGADSGSRLLRDGFAFIPEGPVYAKSLGRLGVGDTLLLYVNGSGVIATSVVGKVWDRRTYNATPLKRVYRVPVKWRQLARPIIPTELRRQVGYVPSRAFQRITVDAERVERLLKAVQA